MVVEVRWLAWQRRVNSNKYYSKRPQVGGSFRRYRADEAEERDGGLDGRGSRSG